MLLGMNQQFNDDVSRKKQETGGRMPSTVSQSVSKTGKKVSWSLAALKKPKTRGVVKIFICPEQLLLSVLLLKWLGKKKKNKIALKKCSMNKK